MALRGLNDLPGAIPPYSPHRLLYGRDPIECGDMPPIVDENRCEDALAFFPRLGREPEEVQQKVVAICEKNKKGFCKTHTEELREVGDCVWVRNLPKHEHRLFYKLARIWSGPYEILKNYLRYQCFATVCLGEGRAGLCGPQAQEEMEDGN